MITVISFLTETTGMPTTGFRGKPHPPMGPGGPLLVRQGDVALHKEQKDVGQHGRDHTGSFTQVQKASGHKTLLLLWWIDGKGGGGAQHTCPAGVASGQQRVRAYGGVSDLKF